MGLVKKASNKIILSEVQGEFLLRAKDRYDTTVDIDVGETTVKSKALTRAQITEQLGARRNRQRLKRAVEGRVTTESVAHTEAMALKAVIQRKADEGKTVGDSSVVIAYEVPPHNPEAVHVREKRNICTFCSPIYRLSVAPKPDMTRACFSFRM